MVSEVGAKLFTIRLIGALTGTEEAFVISSVEPSELTVNRLDCCKHH